MSSTKIFLWRKDNIEVIIYPCLVRLIGFGLYASESGNDLSAEEFSTARAQDIIASHFSQRILKEVKKAVKELSHFSQMNGAYGIEVDPPEIVFGVNDRMGGSSTSCSLKDFLEKGTINSYVIQYFGMKGLAEMTKTADSIFKKAGKEIPAKNKRIQKAIKSVSARNSPDAKRCPNCKSFAVTKKSGGAIGGEVFLTLKCNNCGFEDTVDEYKLNDWYSSGQ